MSQNQPGAFYELLDAEVFEKNKFFNKDEGETKYSVKLGFHGGFLTLYLDNKQEWDEFPPAGWIGDIRGRISQNTKGIKMAYPTDMIEAKHAPAARPPVAKVA